MLHSMTGYGKGVASEKDLTIEIELKGVNHRFLEFAVKAPRNYGALELEIKSLLQKSMQRGRIELSISKQQSAAKTNLTSTDLAAFKELFNYSCQALKDVGLTLTKSQKTTLGISLISKQGPVNTVDSSTIDDSERRVLFSALESAQKAFLAFRLKEGENLRLDLAARAQHLGEIRDQIDSLRKEVTQRLFISARDRVAELMASQVEESRWLSEVAILGQRVDITEELTRVSSHLSQLAELLTTSPDNSPAGRRLEFLLQEIGREFNTISNKAQDASLQSLCVEAKCELEKMREQVANVE